MLPENNDKPKFSDYPSNLFEESRDHANQWDVTVLWPEPKAQSREENLVRAVRGGGVE